MKGLLIGILTLGSISAFANATFYRCTAVRNFVAPGCPKQGCYDISIGIKEDGSAKAVAWHYVDGSFFKKPLVEFGIVQDVIGPFIVDGQIANLEENNSPLLLTKISLQSNNDESISRVKGSAIIKGKSGRRNLSLECYELSSKKFLSWAMSTDTNHRQLVMRELYKSML